MTDIITLEETDSTNNYLKAHRAELSHGTAVIALRQTAGKGRMGRVWQSSEGLLPFSVLLKNPRQPQTVTLCAAVAVCSALQRLLPDDASLGIKWPNDIILRGKKLCGILCESVSFGECIDVICGIGINLTQSEEYFRQAGLPYAASLRMLTGIVPDREPLVRDIAELLLRYCEAGFSSVFEEYRSRCVTIGRQVRLIENGSERVAFAEDIAENGFLVCRDDSGRFEVSSGEVSVRGLMDYI